MITLYFAYLHIHVYKTRMHSEAIKAIRDLDIVMARKRWPSLKSVILDWLFISSIGITEFVGEKDGGR